MRDLDTEITKYGEGLAASAARKLDSEIMSDAHFAVSIRRLLLSIATLVKQKYGSDLLLIILKGR